MRRRSMHRVEARTLLPQRCPRDAHEWPEYLDENPAVDWNNHSEQDPLLSIISQNDRPTVFSVFVVLRRFILTSEVKQPSKSSQWKSEQTLQFKSVQMRMRVRSNAECQEYEEQRGVSGIWRAAESGAIALTESQYLAGSRTHWWLRIFLSSPESQSPSSRIDEQIRCRETRISFWLLSFPKSRVISESEEHKERKSHHPNQHPWDSYSKSKIVVATG